MCWKIIIRRHVKMASTSSSCFQTNLSDIVLFVFILFVLRIQALPEAGKGEIILSQNDEFGAFKKISLKESVVKMTGTCTSSEKESPKINLQWKMKFSQCAEQFLTIKPSSAAFRHIFDGEINGESIEISCDKINHVALTDVSRQRNITRYNDKTSNGKASNQPKPDGNRTRRWIGEGHRVYRAVSAVKKPQLENPPIKDPGKSMYDAANKKQHELKLPWSGAYMLIIKAKSFDDTKKFTLNVKVEMRGKRGYLSATEWPLLPFFGVMSFVYLFYAIGWFVASCCNWRDLLRIQFWIGAVIALGMLEKALFFTEYQNVNITGEESNGLVVFAELVSCMKRTLARILVIIVSMGFGIVKPRLGSALPKILASGLLFFILASIEGCFRALSPKASPSKQQLIAAIPLVVLDSVLCWWIFTALVQTTRTLRIRKNAVKLSLYRHFTNTLVFAVVASVIYMAWSIKTHTFSACNDWAELWLDEAFWPFLFSLILLVIMILWRPTNNNQRYAFTPLVDLSDDEQEDPALSDAFAGMKLRNMKKESNGTLKNRSADEDLKWVEENIPSIPSTVLPSLDSDEEIMTTKLEMSKME